MDIDTLIIAAAGLGLALLSMVPFLLHMRRRERRTDEQARTAQEQGLDEPATLYPRVHPGACIGIGNCIRACPEHDVIGLRDGQAVVIQPAKCVGHGACERACPVEAIQLVFGTATRGVDIPRIQQNFETNVPGIYVIGELGGMGLIRNAFEQGRQCVEGIARERRRGPEDALDAVIVGCGPAGLSASLHCLNRGLRFRTLEREAIGGAVSHYPRKKLVMTAPLDIPGYGKLRYREVLKEDLIGVWKQVIEKTGLEINTGETVQSVTPTSDGAFVVESNRGHYRTRRVILAIGRRGVPRKLGVPGEDLPKVAYSLLEPEAFSGDRVMIVGGGDSAVEAALALSELPRTAVAVSYRRDRFSRIKADNRRRIEEAFAQRRVNILWESSIVEIAHEAVSVRVATGETSQIPNDAMFIFAGGELPTRFLESCGVAIDTKFGEPL